MLIYHVARGGLDQRRRQQDAVHHVDDAVGRGEGAHGLGDPVEEHRALIAIVEGLPSPSGLVGNAKRPTGRTRPKEAKWPKRPKRCRLTRAGRPFALGKRPGDGVPGGHLGGRVRNGCARPCLG